MWPKVTVKDINSAKQQRVMDEAGRGTRPKKMQK